MAAADGDALARALAYIEELEARVGYCSRCGTETVHNDERLPTADEVRGVLKPASSLVESSQKARVELAERLEALIEDDSIIGLDGDDERDLREAAVVLREPAPAVREDDEARCPECGDYLSAGYCESCDGEGLREEELHIDHLEGQSPARTPGDTDMAATDDEVIEVLEFRLTRAAARIDHLERALREIADRECGLLTARAVARAALKGEDDAEKR
jgi:hypothetical protein